MNRFEVYIHIDGPKFDPERFRSSLPRGLSGHTRPVFRMNRGVKGVVGSYWHSRKLGVAESKVGAALAAMIKRYEPHLARAKRMGANRVSAVVASLRGDPALLSGFHFPPDALRMLAKSGADLDISLSYPRD